MEEAGIDQKRLEDAMLKALPILFPHLLKTTSGSAPVEFYDKFQREADERDSDFVKKYGEDLDTTLIFAGLFSAVASAFIIDVESQLQPDFTQSSYIMLTILANISLGHPPADLNSVLPQWAGPDPAIAHIEAILYASLAASLLAALIAMMGKQWLNRYSQVEMGGSIIERNRHRQRKMNGMATWHFDFVMESLPLMLQGALLLLGYALSNYLFTIDNAVAGVVVGFTAFGLLFYLLIVSAATLSYNCPFQTPPSLIIRFMIRFDEKHKNYIKRTWKWFRHTFSFLKKRPWRKSARPSTWGGYRFDASTTGNHIELAIAGTHDQPAPMFNKQADWEGYVLDSDCITWLLERFEISMETDVVLPIMGYIPEVVWHAGIKTAPLERVYDMFIECFSLSLDRHPTLKPNLRNKAYLSAKAFLHLAIQRKCVGHESDKAAFASIKERYPSSNFDRYSEDPDLHSILVVMDSVFGNGFFFWDTSCSYSLPHHTWMAHILLYRAWDVVRKGEDLPYGIESFVIFTLQLEPPPPVPIVTDCLLIIGLSLGLELHIDDLSVIDKSRKRRVRISGIYEKLLEIFSKPDFTHRESRCALVAMQAIPPFSDRAFVWDSYRLFHLTMQAPLTGFFYKSDKWEASRLAMCDAVKWYDLLPWAEDPEVILAFLDYHLDLLNGGREVPDDAIQNVLRVMRYAFNPDTIKTLKGFDSTKPSFVRGICRLFRDTGPNRKAALLFLPLIGDSWFNAANPIMEPDEMRGLCEAWASVIDEIEHTPGVKWAILAVLFDMINSSHWRPYLVMEKWKLLDYFTSVPGDPWSLKRCLDNPELTAAVSDMGDPEIMDLWLKILWSKCIELVPEVREQLETVTRGVALSERKTDLDVYVSRIDSELEKSQGHLTWYSSWPNDPTTVALREKVDHLQQARNTLLSLEGANVTSV